MGELQSKVVSEPVEELQSKVEEEVASVEITELT